MVRYESHRRTPSCGHLAGIRLDALRLSAPSSFLVVSIWIEVLRDFGPFWHDGITQLQSKMFASRSTASQRYWNGSRSGDCGGHLSAMKSLFNVQEKPVWDVLTQLLSLDSTCTPLSVYAFKDSCWNVLQYIKNQLQKKKKKAVEAENADCGGEFTYTHFGGTWFCICDVLKFTE